MVVSALKRKCGIDLCAQRPELRFGRQLADFSLAQFSLVSLGREADRIDPPGDDDGDRFERRQIIGDRSADRRELRDRQHILRTVRWSVR